MHNWVSLLIGKFVKIEWKLKIYHFSSIRNIDWHIVLFPNVSPGGFVQFVETISRIKSENTFVHLSIIRVFYSHVFNIHIEIVHCYGFVFP